MIKILLHILRNKWLNILARKVDCKLTPEEQEYLKNDALVVKEVLEIMFEERGKKL